MKRSLSVLTVLFLVLLLITGVLWLRESGHVAFERVLVPSSAEKQNNFESLEVSGVTDRVEKRTIEEL
jgi:preprotein translocase subunit SecG